MNFQRNPIALAIAMTLVGAQGGVFAMSRPAVGRVPPLTHDAALPFDDAGVTLLSDDWDAEDEALLDLELLDGNDPFVIADLREEGLATLAYAGVPSKPCGGYGVAKLTVVAPKGGVVSGGEVNCGKSVPKRDSDGVPLRDCSYKTCKNYGDVTSLDATPDEGWEFVKWLNACKPAGSEPVCVLDLNRNRKVSAKFRRIR